MSCISSESECLCTDWFERGQSAFIPQTKCLVASAGTCTIAYVHFLVVFAYFFESSNMQDMFVLISLCLCYLCIEWWRILDQCFCFWKKCFFLLSSHAVGSHISRNCFIRKAVIPPAPILFLAWHSFCNDSQFGLHDKMLPFFTLAVWERVLIWHQLVSFNESFRDFRISPRIWKISYKCFVIAVC